MKLSRIAAGLVCLVLLLTILPPAALGADEARAKGSCFENPNTLKVGKKTTGKITEKLAKVFYVISLPEGGEYRVKTDGSLPVEVRLYRASQKWAKTFAPGSGDKGLVDQTFSVSKKDKYFLSVEPVKSGKTGSFKITLSAEKTESPALTEKPIPAPAPEPTPTPAPKPTEKPVNPAPATGERALAAPVIQSIVQIHYQSVTVKWSAVSGADGYGLYKSSSASGTYSLVRYVSATSASVSSLSIGKQYYFQVRAFTDGDSAKDLGTPSTPSYIWMLDRPYITSVAQSSMSSIRIRWNAVKSAAGYTVYRSTSSTGPFQAIANTKTATFWTDFKLALGTYYYKVIAFRLYGTKKFYGPPSTVRMTRMTSNWTPTPTPVPTADLTQTATPTPLPQNDTVTYRALLIGNSNYEAPVSDLDAGADISEMSSMLSSLNMGGRKYSVTSHTNQTANGILSAIPSAFSGADADDVSLFYYSGHGVVSEGTYAGALVGVDITYVTTAMLHSALSQVPGTVIVLLDSCGSGAAIQSKSMAVTGGAETPPVVADSPGTFNSAVVSAFAGMTARSAEMGTGSKFKVITACAIATSAWQNIYGGFFTQGITKSAKLSGSTMYGDSDKNGLVTQQEAYVYARNYSLSVNDQQSGIPAWDMQVQVYPSDSGFPFFQK